MVQLNLYQYSVLFLNNSLKVYFGFYHHRTLYFFIVLWHGAFGSMPAQYFNLFSTLCFVCLPNHFINRNECYLSYWELIRVYGSLWVMAEVFFLIILICYITSSTETAYLPDVKPLKSNYLSCIDHDNLFPSLESIAHHFHFKR